MAALEERNTLEALDTDDPIYNRIRNLAALLYEADDLLDKSLFLLKHDGFSKAAEGDGSTRKNQSDAMLRQENASIIITEGRSESTRENQSNAMLRHENASIKITADRDDSTRENQRDVKIRHENSSIRITKKVGLFFSSHNPIIFPLTMGRDIRRTSQQIEDLVTQLLNNFDHINDPQSEFESTQEFKLAENRIIGRESDKNDLIKIMLQPKTHSKTHVSVIPIVGSPGVGKSTLAKYVYNDEKVRNHFDLKIWIRSSDLTDKEIVQEIVKACTNTKANENRISRKANNSHSRYFDFLGCRSDRFAAPKDSTSKIETDISDSNRKYQIDISERRLRREIKGKLFLLILDDASIKRWQYLKDLLAKGARGSHILVTTKSIEIADHSSTDSKVTLNGLDDEHSWSLFKIFAFGKQDQVEPDLEKIGKIITKICNGVPLTIKVAASLLHGKSQNHWVSFRDGILGMEHKDIENHILRFSYTALPTRLRACFAYCSLFPEDYNFNKHDLISLWTAQGYINQQQGQSMEETAEKYFLELSRRCFFEDVRTDALGNILWCKMHPIMRNLACEQAAGAVNMYVANSFVNQVPDSACRHVSYNCKNSSMKVLPSLVDTENLRTLVSVKEPVFEAKMDGSVCCKLISRLKSLRVLDLHNLGVHTLPASISKLIHLRYLDLSKNGLITLPRSVTELYNLQTLKLNSCIKLTKLCGDFGQLINLKRFEVNECDSLTCMPLGLEKLVQLETLSRFVISKDCSRELEALRKLNSLRGRLAIELSGDWEIAIPNSPRVDLHEKMHLEELKIFWEKPLSEKTSYSQLLEQLKPNQNLKILCIEGYKGEYFPSWLDSLPNLVVVSIEGCGKCEHLPPFSELRSLKQLTLRHMVNVKYVEPDSQNRGSQGSTNRDSQGSTTAHPPFFPSLEELTLHNFYKLERWKIESVVTSGKETIIQKFPKLTKLKLRNCPNLTSMPLFMNVLELNLINVNKTLLVESSNKMHMAIRQELKNQSRIENLQIKGCNDLDSFRTVRMGLGDLPSLKQLVVDGCDELLSLASELKYFISLEKLEISNCKELDLSDEGIITASNTRNSTISWISSKMVRQQSEIPRSPWASLQCLYHLTLRDIRKMETLPEGLQHVQSLKTLWISACSELKALPEWISNLTSLQHLRIDSCPGVKSLPDGISEVKSLVKVEITGCPELMKRCKVHTGEDWNKIKHAWVVLHKSWRCGLMSEQGASQKRSNASEATDVKYFIVSAEEIV